MKRIRVAASCLVFIMVKSCMGGGGANKKDSIPPVQDLLAQLKRQIFQSETREEEPSQNGS